MKGMPGGMQNLVKQANQMQNKMKKLQAELEEREYESTSGGGAVSVKVKGETNLIELKIDEDVFKSGDVEMLQDMVLTAINDVLKTAKEAGAAEMEKITGKLGMPGLF